MGLVDSVFVLVIVLLLYLMSIAVVFLCFCFFHNDLRVYIQSLSRHLCEPFHVCEESKLGMDAGCRRERSRVEYMPAVA
jgi:hypothetical protein